MTSESGRSTGTRRTKQKSVVRDALAANDDFVTAQQLFTDLKVTGASIGLATVYRTLNALVDSGDADTLHAENGEQLFRLCGPRHHHHLICTQCGKTVEIQAPLEEWVERVGRENGFVNVRHVVDLYGLCNDCATRVQPRDD